MQNSACYVTDDAAPQPPTQQLEPAERAGATHKKHTVSLLGSAPPRTAEAEAGGRDPPPRRRPLSAYPGRPAASSCRRMKTCGPGTTSTPPMSNSTARRAMALLRRGHERVRAARSPQEEPLAPPPRWPRPRPPAAPPSRALRAAVLRVLKAPRSQGGGMQGGEGMLPTLLDQCFQTPSRLRTALNFP